MKAASEVSITARYSVGAVSATALAGRASEVDIMCPFKPKAVMLNESAIKDYHYEMNKSLLSLKLPSAGVHKIYVQ